MTSKAKSKGRPDPNTVLSIAVSVAAAGDVNPNDITRLFIADGLSTFPIKGNLFFSNSPKSLPRNPPGWPILHNLVFHNFRLADKPFAKVLQRFETCVLVNKNLRGKLFSSLESPIKFDQNFKVTSATFFTPDFDLLSCKLEYFTLKVLYWVILY